MVNDVFLYIGAFLPFVWGVAHLFPTRSIVKSFGDISNDNRRIVAMEWIIEGISLIFIGVMLLIVTLLGQGGIVSIAVYWILFSMLNTLSLISLFTGFRIRFLPFRLCPVIFTGSPVFILLGMYV